MVIRRIDPLSVGKVAGLLYALIGLCIGAVVSLIALAGASFAGAASDGTPLVGVLFGVGAIVMLPIVYGVMGFVGTFVAAAIYNLVAGMVGGVRIEVEQR